MQTESMQNSPRKTASDMTLMKEERSRMLPSSTKSCESLYSVNTTSFKGSASLIYRRKTPPMAGGTNGHRQPTMIPANTEVRQRVLSARRLRMKTFQNQLADAQQTIADLAHENRILRTLHKRQDSALAKYESTNAELPQLLHSHAEELRVWQTKYRNLQTQTKELEQKLKQKEAIILSLGDQNKYYAQLNKDRNLDERQRLTEKLQQLELRLQEKDNDMKLFARKVQLESKNFKKQLTSEQTKQKDLMLKLEKQRLELTGYRKIDELGLDDKFGDVSVSMRRKVNYNIGSKETKLESLQDKEKLLGKSESSAAEDDGDVENETAADFISSNRSKLGKVGGTKQSLTVRKKPSTSTVILTSSTQHIKNETSQRRVDRGDGDAAALNDVLKPSSIKTVKKLSAMQDKSKIVSNYQEDFEHPHDMQKDNDSVDADLLSSNADGNDDNSNVDGDSDADVAENSENGYEDELDGEEIEEVDEEIEEDEIGDEEEVESVSEKMAQKPKNSARMKEDISCIRKQISDDYKEREAFLDTFCRQATSTSLREETPKRNSISMGHTLPNNRKHKLLAALKAIDDNKSED